MLFFSKCTYCKHTLLMTGRPKHKSYSCSKCIPKNSAARDEINETYKYELIRFKNRGK
jgi:DNA-directed RNA polymerase subunit RPC12/RpoP